MCGIVGAAAQREVLGILMEGLQRLEYRGYDSAGVAVIGADGALQRRRAAGKVQVLKDLIAAEPVAGTTGISHTRWATHGVPNESNAHPHCNTAGTIALVHNGIIENWEALRSELAADGYSFASDTDSETIVHLVDRELARCGTLLEAVRATVARLEGAFSLGVVHSAEPHRVVAARLGSPLVVGVGIGENFIASDVLALRAVTDRFIFLEEGDLVQITPDAVQVWDSSNQPVDRAVDTVEMGAEDIDRGNYRHHMLKEIHEQPRVVRNTLQGRVSRKHVLEEAFGLKAKAVFDQVEAVTIVACGTSYYAGCVARYWIEELVGIPCQVEIASEFRYRTVAPLPNTLFVTLSQSGETADTLAALRKVGKTYAGTLTICNVPTSTMIRESDLHLTLEAGTEVGVASTKAFVAMLVDLLLLTLLLGRRRGLPQAREEQLVAALHALPDAMEQVLTLDDTIRGLSGHFIEKHHALFLGRGVMYPIAMEGALKLKEISYIHAEGYPAGELKHGPLALVDDDMPVVAVAPNNDLLEKLQSNLQEVKARGGQLYVFADAASGFRDEDGTTVIQVPHLDDDLMAPIVYTVPLQLLSYYVAVQKGTDVDQPRNLAKSVTVE